ncbi:hypothetical protein O181_009743 [Austropuccinia psidii MF-1]|uniref:Integrase catalytic domain-containing protein n=1 Tax=Austropuccinia psidii MF-1 TaxID=1389203 RepID=A0A9Q3BRM3_9BASI|nr:hypothetical protein [Austropuccinia psidii MF-1]
MNDKSLDIKDISTIPVLDGTNYGHWQMRMKIHLRSRDLLKLCKNSQSNDTSTSSVNKGKKASFEAINLITIRITERVFREVVNSETIENSHLLWTKISEQYASKRAINRGQVWMDWQCCFYDGNLQNYIDNCCKLMMELDAVSIVVPNEFLSYSLLGKLGGNPQLRQFVETLTFNKDIIEKPMIILSQLQDFASHIKLNNSSNAKKEHDSSALITSFEEPHKIIFYCSNSKHNNRCTTHKKEDCWAENPQLRLSRQEKKCKNNARTHLSIAQALTTIGGPMSPMCNQVIIDCGATHHMFNSPEFFPDSFKNIRPKVATGDSQSNLLALGIGNTELKCQGKVLKLENCLFVPKLKCNLIIKYPLDIIHIDVVGPITPESVSGSHFLLTIVDQATSYKIVKFLTKKYDSYNQFVGAKNYMENHHDRKIKKLVSDRGGEFLNQKFKNLSTECGFVHIFSPPETPEHNSFAKRANHTVLEEARCLLNHSNLPNQCWAEAVNTSVFLCNLSPTASRGNKSPHSLWTDSPIKLTKLRTFGCQAVIHSLKRQRDWKLAPPGQEGVLLGFENGDTAYQILRLSDLKVAVTRNVTFNKKIFPTIAGRNRSSTWCVKDEHTDHNVSLITEPANNVALNNSETMEDELPTEESCIEDVPPLNSPTHPVSDNNSMNHENSFEQQQRNDIIPRHPTLITSNVDSIHILPYSRRVKTFIMTSNVPKTYRLALQCEEKNKWTDAIRRELLSMNKLKVWDIVDLRSDYKLVGTTWVFKLKRNHLHQAVEYKARLCAQGFTQTPGVDFDKTYAPTGRLNSLRALIAHACANGLEFHQIDVKSAFLNAPLTETVYLSIPQGLDIDRQRYCLRLKKAIYGLKQAPLAWYNQLKDWLHSVGFNACTLDPCVFHRKNPDTLWIYVHVDDMAIFGSNIQQFKREINNEFNIKDVGLADLLLGVKIHQLDNCITLDQQHFIDSLLDLYGMQNCKPVDTPLVPNDYLAPATDDERKAFGDMGVTLEVQLVSLTT